jgi:hypothetical protein
VRTRRRWIWPAALGALVVLVGALTALGLPRNRGDLDPESPTPAGARAVVRILRAHGVRVDVVRSASDLRAAAGSTVLVTNPWFVPFETVDTLAGAEADLVLLGPNAVVLDQLGVSITPRGNRPATSTDPVCTMSDAAAAGRARAGGTLYRGGDQICYPADRNSADGSVASAVAGGRRVTVIGQPDVLRNGYLAQEGNAALALRLLGAQSVLEWYMPDPLELKADEVPTLGELTPRWVRWVPAQLAVTALVVMLWRGPRLGRLVPEPLPVVVRAAETQEGRARLYRQAGARDRAASTLRTATLRRLARRFEATGSSPGLLADRVAAGTGRSAPSVQQTLLGPAPADDAALVRLADALDAIEQDVAGTRGPTTTATTRDGQ